MAAAVEAHELTRRYGETVAVDRLTFAVQQGHVLGVLGPNGAGKTTAIRMLTTMLPPTSGRFTVAGVPGDDENGIRRKIGVLPESAGYPRLETGEEYLTYHARLHGVRRQEARIRAHSLLEEVGLADRAGALVGTYSRGMRQRLGIARTLVGDPAVIFLDEPTLGLDPAGQRHALDMVGRMARDRGVTVLLSTHLLDEVEQVCSEVLILSRGRVAAFGRVEEIARSAAAPRSARLRVPPGEVMAAIELLDGLREVAETEATAEPGEIVLRLSSALDAEPAAAAVLRSLLDAGIPVMEFSLEGGRLSDAFLEVVSP